MNVYVIDESEKIREQLRVQLEELSGVTVVGEASTALQAFPIIRTRMVDLLIMDYPMAMSSSVVFVASLKNISPSTAIYVFTHSPSIKFQQACTKVGTVLVEQEK